MNRAISISLNASFCHAVDSMGDMMVRFKCATAFSLYAAPGVHVSQATTPIASQRARVSSVGKTPSFSFCQVDMYALRERTIYAR